METSEFFYFVGRTKHIHQHLFAAMDYSIMKDNEDEDDDAGTISGFVYKEEAILLLMIFDTVQFEDALTYLSTMN